MFCGNTQQPAKPEPFKPDTGLKSMLCAFETDDVVCAPSAWMEKRSLYIWFVL